MQDKTFNNNASTNVLVSSIQLLINLSACLIKLYLPCKLCSDSKVYTLVFQSGIFVMELHNNYVSAVNKWCNKITHSVHNSGCVTTGCTMQKGSSFLNIYFFHRVNCSGFSLIIITCIIKSVTFKMWQTFYFCINN